MSNTFIIKNTITNYTSVIDTFDLPIFNTNKLNNTFIGSTKNLNIGNRLIYDGNFWIPEFKVGEIGITGYNGHKGYTGPKGSTYTEWLQLSKNTNQTVSSNTDIEWDNVDENSTILFNTPEFILEEKSTYLIKCNIYMNNMTNPTGYIFGVYDTNNKLISKFGEIIPSNLNFPVSSGGGLTTIITPLITQGYKIKSGNIGTNISTYIGDITSESCQCTIFKFK
jgi:hypothetical protein